MPLSLTVNELLYAAECLSYEQALVIEKSYSQLCESWEFYELIELVDDLVICTGIDWTPLEDRLNEALVAGTAKWESPSNVNRPDSEGSYEDVLCLALKSLAVRKLLDRDERRLALLPIRSLFA